MIYESNLRFIMKLLSIGQEVKVLEPESLKNKMIKMLEATLKHYTNK
ncbi:WYL domain-containing protein [Flavobacterium sp. LB3P122]